MSGESVCFELREVRRQVSSTFTLEIESLHFAAGRIHALVGPNGSGKTSLLRMLNLLDAPTSGEIRFFGQTIRPEMPNLTAIRRRMTLVMQSPFLFRGSVQQNVEYGLKVRGVPRRERALRVSAALEEVGLRGFERRRADELSGGEAKCVALARALVVRPEVLLLDEPTEHMDRATVRMIEDRIMKAHSRDGATVILTTHDLDQARRLTPEITLLVNGYTAPVPPDNVFRCEIVGENSEAEARIANGLTIRLETEQKGPAHITIDPADILVSFRPLESSARNCVKGVIQRVVCDERGVRLEVNAGVLFHVLITRTSWKEMSLTPGMEVFLTFKTSSVRVL